MLAIRSLAPGVKYLALIGTGKQACGHLEALADLFPGLCVDVHGTELAMTEAFCDLHRHLPLQISPRVGRVQESAQVVITVTSSKRPIYEEAVRPGRLLIGVGAFNAQMAEYSPDCVNHSQVFVDDPEGGRHEAGDLIQANVDWQSVSSLADAIDGRFDPTRASLFKSVGCAAWDLAAGRCAVKSLEAERG
jgi:1-piperideine-2-carboxylate/1-pyrroline-2-carboxylate reductase [NAD(P)H]